MIPTNNSQDNNKIREELYFLLDKKKAELSVYSTYNFLHTVEDETLSTETFIKPLRKNISTGTFQIKNIDIEGFRHFFIYHNLAWDTEYFKRKVYKIELILFKHRRPDILSRAVSQFIEYSIFNDDYFLINIPCEDLTLLQGLSQTGFRLVETRLNYYFPNIKSAEPPLYPVRKADKNDIPALKDIAIRMRNRYDRIHADPAFSDKIADAYLGMFIEESVKGFADMVIIPDLPGKKPFGFLAASNPTPVLGYKIAKLVLAAVDNTYYKGWLSHLLSAVIYELKTLNVDILTTITQASNRPAIRTWEKAGFRLGYVTHVYSYSR
jgi:dTDP-4-amino-4,6-dideoxy-D-galactose acyltransferase